VHELVGQAVRPHNRSLSVVLAVSCAWLAGCAHGPSPIPTRGISKESLPIDLSRFMGEWYVIAHIPTPTEANAFEAVESYALRDDGAIDVRFRFCEGGLDGERRELTMLAWVYDPATNADWRVRPFWPLRLTYQIAELDPDYRVTVVTNPHGYAWVMARRPQIPEAELSAITQRLAERGFDTTLLRRVPHADGACRRAL
jgi:apolipoprotein D and lipocalin family protein